MYLIGTKSACAGKPQTLVTDAGRVTSVGVSVVPFVVRGHSRSHTTTRCRSHHDSQFAVIEWRRGANRSRVVRRSRNRETTRFEIIVHYLHQYVAGRIDGGRSSFGGDQVRSRVHESPRTHRSSMTTTMFPRWSPPRNAEAPSVVISGMEAIASVSFQQVSRS